MVSEGARVIFADPDVPDVESSKEVNIFWRDAAESSRLILVLRVKNITQFLIQYREPSDCLKVMGIFLVLPRT